MNITVERKGERWILTEFEKDFIESVIKLTVTEACAKMAEERKVAIAEALKIHTALCPIKMRMDRYQWILLGACLGSGAGGGIVGGLIGGLL